MSETLKEEEYMKVECKFEGKERWVRSGSKYESLPQAARAGSVFMNQEDVKDYRVVKVNKKEEIVHS